MDSPRKKPALEIQIAYFHVSIFTLPLKTFVTLYAIDRYNLNPGKIFGFNTYDYT